MPLLYDTLPALLITLVIVGPILLPKAESKGGGNVLLDGCAV